MEITDKIKILKREQLEVVIAARRSVPIASWLSINAKARSACALRHPKWQEAINVYTNSIIEAAIKTRMQDPISIGTLVSAFESMGLGVIAKKDLTLEEYDLIISPVISAFPELIVLDQDWTPEPMDEDSRFKPRLPYNLPPVDLQPDKEKKHRPFRRTEDLESKVEEEAFDTTALMASLKPKEETKPKISKEDALQAMLNAMKPKTEQRNVEQAVAEKIIDTVEGLSQSSIGKEILADTVEQENLARIIDDVKEHWPEAVAVPIEEIVTPKLRFLKMVTEEGGFKLKDQETGEYLGEKFTSPIEAIIWAAKNGMKIK